MADDPKFMEGVAMINWPVNDVRNRLVLRIAFCVVLEYNSFLAIKDLTLHEPTVIVG